MLITQKHHIYKTLKKVKLRLRSVQVFVLLMLKMCVIFGQEIPDKTILVIDSDHGDVDSSAMGENGILEKDVALTIVKEILRWNHTLLDGNIISISPGIPIPWYPLGIQKPFMPMCLCRCIANMQKIRKQMPGLAILLDIDKFKNLEP